MRGLAYCRLEGDQRTCRVVLAPELVSPRGAKNAPVQPLYKPKNSAETNASRVEEPSPAIAAPPVGCDIEHNLSHV